MPTKSFNTLRNIFLSISLVTLICCCISCKKTSTSANNQNELKATVKLISGEIIVINASSGYARMDCENGFSIDNSKQFPAPGLALQTYNNSGDCITSAGTYTAPNFVCSFSQVSGTVYENIASAVPGSIGAHNPGSITFTSFSNTDVECSFTATCMHGANDSVIINGTFKGNYRGN